MRESDVCRKTVKTLFNLRSRQLERFGWCWQVHNPLVVTRYNGCPGETLRWLGAAVRREHHQPCTGETLFYLHKYVDLGGEKIPRVHFFHLSTFIGVGTIKALSKHSLKINFTYIQISIFTMTLNAVTLWTINWGWDKLINRLYINRVCLPYIGHYEVEWPQTPWFTITPNTANITGI